MLKYFKIYLLFIYPFPILIFLSSEFQFFVNNDYPCQVLSPRPRHPLSPQQVHHVQQYDLSALVNEPGVRKPNFKIAGQTPKTAQNISIRLRNLLKLPKAHKWVCYEWFYSNIDK